MSINSVRNTVLSKIGFLRKTRHWRVLFVPLFFLASSGNPSHADELCSAQNYDETVSIKSVIDGDTILLGDGRFLRLIGINTPELNSKAPPAEPFAQEAKDALSALLKNVKQIGLIHDQDKRDRYQRILSHAFLPDGTSIQQTLLEAGMGQHLFIPPNDRFFNCYQTAEQKAQSQKIGIWTHSRFRLMNASELTLRHRGFYNVSGTIRDIKRRKGIYWLQVTERFSFRIDEDDMKYFKNLRPETLRTHTLQAKGWIFPYKSGLNMRIHHPKNIKILN